MEDGAIIAILTVFC